MDARAFDKSEPSGCCGGPPHENTAAGSAKLFVSNLENVMLDQNQKVVRSSSRPTLAMGEIEGLCGPRARGAKVKVVGMTCLQPREDGENGTLARQSRVGRRVVWLQQANLYQSGARQVGPARTNAVARGGGRAKVGCHADI
jgi:hypothetical protein